MTGTESLCDPTVSGSLRFYNLINFPLQGIPISEKNVTNIHFHFNFSSGDFKIIKSAKKFVVAKNDIHRIKVEE
jgi:hypothetical protein